MNANDIKLLKNQAQFTNEALYFHTEFLTAQPSADTKPECLKPGNTSIFFIKLSYSLHTLRRNHQTSCLIS